jgi:hypothetical protein
MDSPVKLPSASQASVPAGSLRADPSSLADAILDVLYLSDEYIVVNKVRFWGGSCSHGFRWLTRFSLAAECSHPMSD